MTRGQRVILLIVIFVLIFAAYVHARNAAPRHDVVPPAVSSFDVVATSTSPLYPVIRDIDGDTITVLINGATTTIRFIGVDTPETVDPRKPVECFGHEASAETKKLVDGTAVRLELDPSQGTLDKYHRTLAYVYLPDGTMLDEFLIAEGYGHEYTYKTAYKYQSEFKSAQKSAQQAHLGLWSPSTCNGNTGITSTDMRN